MKTRTAMQLLVQSNPFPASPTSTTVSRHGKRRGVTAVSLALALIMGLGGVAVATTRAVDSRTYLVTTWSATSPQASNASHKDYVDPHADSVRPLLDQMKAMYPLPPGVDPVALYAPLDRALPMAPGATLPVTIPDRRRDPYLYGVAYQPVDEDHLEQRKYLGASELAGTVGVLAANAWYTYWLNGTATQKAAAEATIAQIPEWKDLNNRIGRGEPGELTAGLAKAVENGDPQPVREWLDGQLWNSPLGG